MYVRVRGQQGQDDGDKRNEGEAEVHNKQAAKLLAVPHPCQLSFLIYDNGPGHSGTNGLW